MRAFFSKLENTVKRTSVRALIFSLLLFTAITAAVASIFFSAKTTYESKLVDTKLIQFLQLEKSTTLLQDNLLDFKKTTELLLRNGLDLDQSVVKVSENKAEGLFGEVQGRLNRVDFGGVGDEDKQYEFVVVRQKKYLVYEVNYRCVEALLEESSSERGSCQSKYLSNGSIKRKIRYYVLTRAPQYLFGSNSGASLSSISYLANNYGQLLFSNSTEVNPISLIGRELVQAFIQKDLQFGFKTINRGGRKWYGLYRQIENSNLIQFFEYSDDQILQIALNSIGRIVFIVLITITILSLIVLWVTNLIIAPLTHLNEWSQRFGRGEFNLRPAAQGIGEVRKLGDRFSQMADGIQKRELSIISLMEEQKEKVKLEGELAITETIQENFLPRSISAKECLFNVGAEYIAAEKASGDWYQYDFDEASGQTVVVVMDVSGHGVGSAMYTAAVAAIYRDYWSSNRGGFNTEVFSSKVHDVFLKLAGGKWHATMVVVTHSKGDTFLRVCNNGHVFPIIYSGTAQKMMKPYRAKMPSDVCGIEKEFRNKEIKVDLTERFAMILYTDGIIEATNSNGKQYGAKRLVKSVKRPELGAASIVSEISTDWRDFTGEEDQEDDVCIVALKLKNVN